MPCLATCKLKSQTHLLRQCLALHVCDGQPLHIGRQLCCCIHYHIVAPQLQLGHSRQACQAAGNAQCGAARFEAQRLQLLHRSAPGRNTQIGSTMESHIHVLQWPCCCRKRRQAARQLPPAQHCIAGTGCANEAEAAHVPPMAMQPGSERLNRLQIVKNTKDLCQQLRGVYSSVPLPVDQRRDMPAPRYAAEAAVSGRAAAGSGGTCTLTSNTIRGATRPVTFR